MASREEIVQVINEMIGVGSDLFERTNDRLRDRTLDRVASTVAMQAARVWKSLQAIAILEPHSLDYQAAMLCRSITEITLDIEYLLTSTKRSDRILSIEDKLTLFHSAFALSIFKMSELSFMKGLLERFTPEERQGLDEILLERRALGVRDSSTTWHGRREYEIYKELKNHLESIEAPAPILSSLNSMDDAFRYLSYQIHSGPAYGAAFAPMTQGRPFQLASESRFDPLLVFGAATGAQALARWGMHIHPESEKDRIADQRDSFQRRLGAGGHG